MQIKKKKEIYNEDFLTHIKRFPCRQIYFFNSPNETRSRDRNDVVKLLCKDKISQFRFIRDRAIHYAGEILDSRADPD